MRIYVRKVGKRTWITDTGNGGRTFPKRTQDGVKQFRDPAGRPSLYKGDTEKDRMIGVAAVAWKAAQERVDRMRKTDYVLVTDEDLRHAGLEAVRTPSNIEWPVLWHRHFEVTKNGGPCGDEDLARLVEQLIQRPAKHDRFASEKLQRSASVYAQQSRLGWILHEVTMRILAVFGLR